MAGGSGWCGDLPEKALGVPVPSRGRCPWVCGCHLPGCREPALGSPFCGHRGVWTGSMLCIFPSLPLTSQGVLLQDAQHCVPLLPVHAGRLGVNAVPAQGCRGL